MTHLPVVSSEGDHFSGQPVKIGEFEIGQQKVGEGCET